MQVKALRGVCIGPGRHLAPDEIAEIDEATVTFLTNIGAVEKYVEPEPEVTKPAKKASTKET